MTIFEIYYQPQPPNLQASITHKPKFRIAYPNKFAMYKRTNNDCLIRVYIIYISPFHGKGLTQFLLQP